MIKVMTPEGGQRVVQIVSPAPDRMTHWARTVDDGPGEWLLLRETKDKMTGKVSYEVIPS